MPILNENIQEVIQRAALLPANERNEILILLSQATSGFTYCPSIYWLLSAVIAIPDLEKAQVMRNAVLLITSNMEYLDRLELIRRVANIPSVQRDRTIALALEVIPANKSANVKLSIIQAVVAVRAYERVDVMRHALQIINDQMPWRDRIHTIQCVVEIPAKSREHYVRERREWFKQYGNLNNTSMCRK